MFLNTGQIDSMALMDIETLEPLSRALPLLLAEKGR